MLLALQPLNLTMILIGVTVGLFIGAMPGSGLGQRRRDSPARSRSSFRLRRRSSSSLPFTMEPCTAGPFSSVTLGIPGASTAVATTFDGRPLARQGRASLALVDCGARVVRRRDGRQYTLHAVCACFSPSVALNFRPARGLRADAAGLCDLHWASAVTTSRRRSCRSAWASSLPPSVLTRSRARRG